MDDKELDKDNPMRGRPAACTSIHGDGKGNIVVGTVCNEIYEIEAADFDGTGDASPMCIMQVREARDNRLARIGCVSPRFRVAFVGPPRALLH